MNRTSIVTLAVLLALVGACSPAPPPVQSPVQALMYRHFAAARDMRTFAITGELDLLQEVARGLSETEVTWGMPPGSDVHVDRIRAAALRAYEAEDLPTALQATAEVALACGDCHLAAQAGLGGRFVTTAPLENGSVSRHMNRLAWISRLLWDGLIGPSERTWSTGAGALADASTFPPPTASHVPENVVHTAAGTLAAIAADAAVAVEPQDRATLLARMWGTCAGCHAQAGVR